MRQEFFQQSIRNNWQTYWYMQKQVNKRKMTQSNARTNHNTFLSLSFHTARHAPSARCPAFRYLDGPLRRASDGSSSHFPTAVILVLNLDHENPIALLVLVYRVSFTVHSIKERSPFLIPANIPFRPRHHLLPWVSDVLHAESVHFVR